MLARECSPGRSGLRACAVLLIPALAAACITVRTASSDVGGEDSLGDASFDAAASKDGATVDSARSDGATIDGGATNGDASALRDNAAVFKDNGHAYLLVCEGQIRFDDARDAAKSAGGHLATLNSRAENDFVGVLVVQSKSQRPECWNSHSGPWLGAERRLGSGAWAWVTGEPWVAADAIWYPGQPDNGNGIVEEDALQAFTLNGGLAWNDTSRSITVAGYVIEWEK